MVRVRSLGLGFGFGFGLGLGFGFDGATCWNLASRLAVRCSSRATSVSTARSCVRARSCISRWSARLTAGTDSAWCAELAAASEVGVSGGVFGSVGGSEAGPLFFRPLFALAKMSFFLERNIGQARRSRLGEPRQEALLGLCQRGAPRHRLTQRAEPATDGTQNGLLARLLGKKKQRLSLPTLTPRSRSRALSSVGFFTAAGAVCHSLVPRPWYRWFILNKLLSQKKRTI